MNNLNNNYTIELLNRNKVEKNRNSAIDIEKRENYKSKSYSINREIKNIIYIKIADYKIAKPPYKFKTVLGSCVAVSLYDRKSRIGSLCHIMLPKKVKISTNKLKFANTALPIIIKELKKYGVNIKNLEAKIFGGAQIYFSSNESVFPEIGKENIKVVKKILEIYGIPVIGEDILGKEGRTVLFDLTDGKVYCKRFSGENIVI